MTTVEPGYSEVHKSDRSFHYSQGKIHVCSRYSASVQPGFQYSRVHYSQVRLYSEIFIPENCYYVQAFIVLYIDGSEA